MTTRDRRSDLDLAVDAVRGDEPSPAALDAAAARVRAALGTEAAVGGVTPGTRHIDRCAGFQALIPAFLDGTLPHDGALLLEDHTRECVPCRRALMAARTPRHAGPASPPGAARGRIWRPAAAAAAAIAVVATGWGIFGVPSARNVQVLTVDGTLYRVTPRGTEPLLGGTVLREDVPLRTAKGSGAVLRLDDGSRVEMRERTQLAVDRRRDGVTVRLDQGDIIIEASHQGSGHLDVRTDDCLASVRGTIFAVAAGAMGSRVAVIEGAVQVRTGTDEHLLRPGEQVSSRPGGLAAAIGEEIAWSRNAAHYARLLEGMQALRRDLDAAIPSQALRHDTRLLDRSPDGTFLYAAIPNVSGALERAGAVVRAHVRDNDALRSWWDSRMGSPEAQARFDEAIGRVARLGGYLGDEIALTVRIDARGSCRGVTLMAEVKDAGAFRQALREEVRDSGLSAGAMGGTVRTSVEDGIFSLDAVPAPVKGAPAAAAFERFAGGAFHRRIAAAYRDGAGWVIAADLGAVLHRESPGLGEDVAGRRTLDALGFLDAKDIVVEIEEGKASTHRTATLGFDGPRHGLAAALASPAPSGALEFVSPDATFAVAAVLQDPGVLARNLYDAMAASDPEARDRRETLRKDLGVDPIDDLAAAFGGDVAFAVDGPILPVPSWKLAIEVYDAAGLQRSLETLAERLTDDVTLSRTEEGGRAYYTLHSLRTEFDVIYTFTDGYLLAAPQRALLDRALQQRAAGYTLPSSSAFRALLPEDGRLNFSAMAYHNLGPALAPLAEAAGAASGDGAAIASAAASAKPAVGIAYAEPDRIVVVSDREGGLGANLASMFGVDGLSSLAALGPVLQRLHPTPPGNEGPR